MLTLTAKQILELARKADETIRHLKSNPDEIHFTILENGVGEVVTTTKSWCESELEGPHNDTKGRASFFI